MRDVEGRQKPVASRLWKTLTWIRLFRLVAASAAMGMAIEKGDLNDAIRAVDQI